MPVDDIVTPPTDPPLSWSNVPPERLLDDLHDRRADEKKSDKQEAVARFGGEVAARRAALGPRWRRVRRRRDPESAAPCPRGRDGHEGDPLIVIQRQFGHSNLGITSIYLQGIDNAEIIDTVHARRAPMVPVSATLRL
jgi:hypothetical protein